MRTKMDKLLKEILRCEVCKQCLPLGPRPVVQLNKSSKIVIISQAPSRRVHETGIPWNDASGKKLKSWIGVSDEIFYNPYAFRFCQWGFVTRGKEYLVIFRHALNALRYGIRRCLNILKINPSSY